MTQPPAKASLLVIFLTVFIDLLGFGMVLPLLPVYARALAQPLGIAAGSPQMGLVLFLLMSSFSAMQFLFAPIWGRVSDRVGRRPILLLGLLGSVVFYALFGLATTLGNLWLLFVARIGAGIAGATISTAQAYIADATTHETRAKGMALIGAAFGLGFTFGPLLGWVAMPSEGGELGAGPGYLAAAISAVALGLAWFRLPETVGTAETKPARRGYGFAGLRDALATPSIGALLVASFVCVTAFANFESTLALLAKDEHGPFAMDFHQVMLLFAFTGFMLALAQGFLVRRLAGRVPEGAMATAGTVIEIIGFMLMIQAARDGSMSLFLIALAVVVTGFAFIAPSLHALLSRRTAPDKQGGIFGLAQSVSALGRIIGPAGVTLYHNPTLADWLGVPAVTLPLWFATVLMGVGLLLVGSAARRGHDFRGAG